MEQVEIKTEQDAQEIFNYCKERLPLMEGFYLQVEQNVTTVGRNEVEPIKGVCLKVFKGNHLVASSVGVDEDDALLDIYKTLLYFYKKSDGKQIVHKPALGKNHFSYK